MPAKSKAQQRFMGMVDAAKKGESESPAVEKAAKSMTRQQARDFAGTKTKGLPEHASKKKGKK
jgi:hypothetical protein